jgi:hypothetical protein
MIESIAPTGSGRSRLWQVTLRVERVLAGRFEGEVFSFAVHSPAKSGLAVGQRRIVRATPVEGGYAVDALQWLPKGPR